MTSTDALEVAVVGVGRMGKHHARTYKKLTGAKLVGVVDASEERAATIADEFGCEAYTSVSDLLSARPNLAAATVAVPTVHHGSAALPLLERGVACLVEKPLAATVEAARELATFAAARGAVLQVGHTERFNPAVRAALAMKINARFIEVHRVSPMTFRSLDVGVVMDMMIHDLDIVLTLANSPLVKVDATGVAVLGEHEDIANARLTFASGCVANITASRLALRTDRKLKVFSETAYVSLDYQKRTGITIRKSNNAEALTRVRQQVAEGADLSQVDYSQLVKIDELSMGPGEEQDPLTAELSSFLAAVRGRTKPEVDGEAGVAAVDAAARVVKAIREHRWEGLSEPKI